MTVYLKLTLFNDTTRLELPSPRYIKSPGISRRTMVSISRPEIEQGDKRDNDLEEEDIHVVQGEYKLDPVQITSPWHLDLLDNLVWFNEDTWVLDIVLRDLLEIVGQSSQSYSPSVSDPTPLPFNDPSSSSSGDLVTHVSHP